MCRSPLQRFIALRTATPTAQTIASGSGTALLLAIGRYYSNGGNTIDSSTFTFGGADAKDDELNESSNLNAYLAWKFMMAAADVVVDMDDEGNGNCVPGGYLALTV